ncbi:collagenase-like [Hermetia illucens]|uniref:collagenase-like n=1 Tax=Hermetia illucens TaxID=343691 RepID=UPI0018CC0A67|nr:collagenase-like [Hermetia illucens]
MQLILAFFLCLSCCCQIPVVTADENNENAELLKESQPVINSTLVGDNQEDVVVRVSDGQQAKERQFPWHVRIKSVKDREAIYCGGSIISADWILTSAHCTFGFEYLIITYGSIYFKKLPHKTASRRWIIHNGFRKRETHHDISLVRVRKPIIFSKDVQPISIVRGDDTLTDFAGQKAIVIGFGASEKRRTWSSTLLYSIVRIISKKDCENYFVQGMVGADIICAQGYYSNTAGSCAGDSGGSLVMRKDDNSYVLIGITSFESQFGCGQGIPTGYTLIGLYSTWIRKMTGIP